MRKIVWGCTAAAVVAVGVGSLTVDYACDHPNSWMGRCFAYAHDLVIIEAHTLRATRQTADVAFRGVQGLMGTAGPGAVWDKHDTCPAHDGPPAACPGPMHAAILPGGVIIHEDEGDGALPAAAMPPVPDLVGGFPVLGGVEECEEAPMPRAEEDAAKMPPVDGDGGRATPNAAPMPACPQEVNRPSHRIEGQPVFPKMQRDGGERPRHPDVDTLEIRPTDLWFFDFIGPF